MSTCAELFAEKTVLEAEATTLAAEQTLLTAETNANNMNRFIVNYNLMLQGCMPGAAAATEAPADPEGVAETRGREKFIEAMRSKLAREVEDARTALGEAEKALDEAKASRDALKAS